MKTFWKIGLAVLVLFFATLGYADSTVVCQEVAGQGCVADLLASKGFPNNITVASDSESPFDPFHAGFDTSDGIDLSGIGYGNPIYVGPEGWVQIPGSLIWVLPADLSGIGCGIENETTCEPVGVWSFNGSWVPAVLGSYFILDENGGVSDLITLANDGPNGVAQLYFASDPTGVPEPGSLILLCTGLIGAAGTIRRKLIG